MTALRPTLFAIDDDDDLATRVANHLGAEVAPHEVRQFDGGEHKVRSLVNVRNADVFVLSSLAGTEALSANDRLCRLLFFIGALKESSVGTVCAVVPYLCYSRKDRQSKARDPVTTKYVAQLFEAVGTDRLITVDVHNFAAFQNAFRCPTEHLEATDVFASHFKDALSAAPSSSPIVISPDIGGTKRAARFRDRLAAAIEADVELALTEKYRSRGVVSGRDYVIGDIAGKVAIVYDDIIASGTTMLRVAEMLMAQGASAVHVVATHGLFTPKSDTLFSSPSVTSVVITDTVGSARVDASASQGKLLVLRTDRLLADAIDRVHSGGSLVELLHLVN